jgi:hypothetical protein
MKFGSVVHVEKEKVNIYDDASFFRWLKKVGNFGVKCPKCNPKYKAADSLMKSTMYCTQCEMLWGFRRGEYNWKKWFWYYIPRNGSVSKL